MQTFALVTFVRLFMLHFFSFLDVSSFSTLSVFYTIRVRALCVQEPQLGCIRSVYIPQSQNTSSLSSSSASTKWKSPAHEGWQILALRLVEAYDKNQVHTEIPTFTGKSCIALIVDFTGVIKSPAQHFQTLEF